MTEASTPTRTLSIFLSGLRFEALPQPVIDAAKALFIDWLGSALAGRDAAPVMALRAFAVRMGPAGGAAEILADRSRTSPLFAALVNAAASHVVEQDDLHNSSVFHPATVVFPPALAIAQERRLSGRDFLTACVAGYEAGIRVGEFLGRSHYKVFHTTGTAGTLAAAAAVARLLELDPERFNHALGSAGTQAAGLWEFLRDAADSKQLHTAKAAADGLLAACLAEEGFTGARQILEGPQGMAAGMSSDADPARLTDRLGQRWAVLETSLKWHASCRHTHPAADALVAVMAEHGLTHDRIATVTARVHQGAIDVLGPVTEPRTTHQAKFSMGTVLGLLAVHGRADLEAFEAHALTDPQVAAFRGKVTMVLDPEIDAAYPMRWGAVVEVTTVDGRTVTGRIDEPKGDPGNALSRQELEDKAVRLALFRGGASEAEMRGLIARAWRLDAEADMRDLLAPTAARMHAAE
jgi:2-methylcitrate dehydratase PrpD